MCGICGLIDPNGLLNTNDYHGIISGMTTSLAHRGPDGEGHWLDRQNDVALGHRRLAVIDVSALGRQPMASADGRIILVFNGEIYNFRRLRRQLEREGGRLRGTSDTEVLVEAIAAWGVRPTLDRLIGIFAFAVWEKHERRLTLARDHLGVKPLYWSKLGDGILFASQPRAFRTIPNWSSELDRQAIVSVLRFGHVSGPASIYRHAASLPPGAMLTWQADAPEPNVHRYYHPVDAAQRASASGLDLPPDGLVDLLDGLFAQVLADQMIADVPLGAFLSGGIDSSFVVAMMQKQSLHPVQTFTIGFDQKDYDEAQDAAEVASYLGTEHTEHIVSDDDIGRLVAQLPEVYDEPFSDASQIPTMLVSGLARKSVTVVLSGDGGDELFAGYNRHLWAPRLWRRIRGQPIWLRNLIATGLAFPPPRFWDGAGQLLPHRSRPRQLADKVDKLSRLLRQHDLPSIYAELRTQLPDPSLLVDFAATTGLSVDQFPEVDDLTALQLADTVGYLPDDILVKVDRASMQRGLEARVPLLDQRIVDFAWHLPRRAKMRDGKGKWLLRQLLQLHLPKRLIDRPKSGFSVPIDDWLRGPLRPWCEATLMEDDRADETLDLARVRQLWREHRNGEKKAGRELWPMIVLVAWINHWRP